MGYVAPGVVLVVKDMEELLGPENKVTFAQWEAIIAVAVKDKYNYNSSATYWLNDMYTIRLMFPEEHEVANENVIGSLETNETTVLIFWDDSLNQFEEMTVEEDFI